LPNTLLTKNQSLKKYLKAVFGKHLLRKNIVFFSFENFKPSKHYLIKNGLNSATWVRLLDPSQQTRSKIKKERTKINRGKNI
jgi:hypothetical protein